MSRLLPYEIYYENNAGEKLELTEVPFVVTECQLFDSRWELGSVKRTAGEGIKVFRAVRSSEERTMTVRAAAGSAQKLSKLLSRMSEVFDSDIAALTPGKLWVNGQYMKCWCTSRQKELSCDFVTSASVVITVLPETPVWCRQKHCILLENDDSGEMIPAADYFYTVGGGSMTVTNSAAAASPMKIIFTGPTDSPSAYINGEIIGANAALAEGEQLVIDQQERTVYKLDEYGERTNCFGSRYRGNAEFAYLPPGESIVQCSGVPKLEVVVIEQRSEPEWTLN